jgi:hypothetical protein
MKFVVFLGSIKQMKIIEPIQRGPAFGKPFKYVRSR